MADEPPFRLDDNTLGTIGRRGITTGLEEALQR